MQSEWSSFGFTNKTWPRLHKFACHRRSHWRQPLWFFSYSWPTRRSRKKKMMTRVSWWERLHTPQTHKSFIAESCDHHHLSPVFFFPSGCRSSGWGGRSGRAPAVPVTHPGKPSFSWLPGLSSCSFSHLVKTERFHFLPVCRFSRPFLNTLVSTSSSSGSVKTRCAHSSSNNRGICPCTRLCGINAMLCVNRTARGPRICLPTSTWTPSWTSSCPASCRKAGTAALSSPALTQTSASCKQADTILISRTSSACVLSESVGLLNDSLRSLIQV